MNISNQFLRIVIFMMVLCSAVDGYSQADEYENDEGDGEETSCDLGGDGEEDFCTLGGEVDEIGLNPDGPNQLDPVLLETTTTDNNTWGGTIDLNNTGGENLVYYDNSGNDSDNTVNGYYFRDKDGDGFGDINDVIITDTPPAGYIILSASKIDCNDEVYRRDNICGMSTWVLDKDNDGYYVKGTEREAEDNWEKLSNPKSPYVKGYRLKVTTEGEDCDDTDPNNDKNNPKSKCFVNPKDDPCANKDLRNREVPKDISDAINARMQKYQIRGREYDVKSFEIQKIEDGYGRINLDNYSLNINKLPNGYSPQQLFEEIRQNFSEFVTGGNSIFSGASGLNFINQNAVEVEPYSDADGLTWNSSNPIGAAMDFDNIMDTSTVICTGYSYENMNWTFTTYRSADHWGHFVSGHRQFGINDNGDGTYSFYLRGADRLGQGIDYLGNFGNADTLFNGAADATWKNLMESLEKFIEEKPGAEVEHFDKNNDDYAKRHEYNKDDCPE